MKKIITLLVYGLSATAFAGQLLVSVDEMNASNNAKPSFTAKSVPVKVAPLIELTAPKLSAPVKSPTIIELNFKPAALSTVKPETFKVRLFTRMLLNEMKTPAIRVDSMIREVRRKVVEAAKSVGHDQVPSIYDQVVGDFYLKP